MTDISPIVLGKSKLTPKHTRELIFPMAIERGLLKVTVLNESGSRWELWDIGSTLREIEDGFYKHQVKE